MREVSGTPTRERRTYDYGWTPKGNLWIAARLPSILTNFTLYIPSSIGHYISGQHFPIQSDDNRDEGTIGVDERGMSWGYGPFLSRNGPDENDILVIQFDLLHGQAIVDLENEEFLDEPFAQEQESVS